MAGSVIWQRSINDTDDGTASFCAAGGGASAAAQSLFAFLVTNIFAHAATILIPVGANKVDTGLRVIAAILLPVFAGDHAFHSIGRWIARCRARKLTIGTAFGGDRLEDALISGALTIAVPVRFAPLVYGRWELPSRRRQIVMLDQRNF